MDDLVSEASLKLGAQLPQLLVNVAELKPCLIVVELVIATDRFADDLAAFTIHEFAGA
ncbi:hypothetical protein LHFGNBLO_006329 (plasmid) [Mesorhizobium sp. AR10]|uniref:hypothetical protein n=1 Tax=Mesorhizobium sp. AR10 TaxID=2865839 RepID=UPI0021601DAB|nr:hypothetical protein [Mesorhizobium sp. AR10]UVK35539.1 hypothetical protein LHFGNBLO_006329 [Mesorhizobium sp. AR10]